MSDKDDQAKEYETDIEKLQKQKTELEAMWHKAQGTIEYLQSKISGLNDKNVKSEKEQGGQSEKK